MNRHDLRLILPAMLAYGARCWARAAVSLVHRDRWKFEAP